MSHQNKVRKVDEEAAQAATPDFSSVAGIVDKLADLDEVCTSRN